MRDEAREGRRSSITRSLVRAAGRPARSEPDADAVTIGGIIRRLEDRSFGWLLALFSIVTLLPLPPGSSLVTALPLLLVTAQLALGYGYVRLPGLIVRRRVSVRRFRNSVARMMPVTRRIEAVVRPRHRWIFAPHHERWIGAALFCVAFALFLPIPLTGWFPAFSIMIAALGFIERDGLAVMVGLGLGAASLVLTATLLVMVSRSADAIL